MLDGKSCMSAGKAALASRSGQGTLTLWPDCAPQNANTAVVTDEWSVQHELIAQLPKVGCIYKRAIALCHVKAQTHAVLRKESRCATSS